MNHPSSPRAGHPVRSRRKSPLRPALETLEDRTTPAFAAWAIASDPEGYVFHDTNGNSVFDAGESALGAGLTVYVDTNENGALDSGEMSTATDAVGHYNLFLPDGTYSIRVVPPSGFQTDALPLGTLVRDFASVESGINPDGSSSYSGLAWVNDSLFATFTRSSNSSGLNDNVMFQVDPLTGSALGGSVAIPLQVGEITFDGTDFWGADWENNYLIRFNSTGQELQRLSFAGMHTNSVDWDGAALRVVDNFAHRIYQIDPAGSGTILGFINTPNENVGGLAFDGTNLWVNGRDTDRVYALNPATGAVLHSFAAPGGFAYGLAIRGSNLWLSDNRSSRVFQYDLGYGGGRIVTVAGADVTGVNLSVFRLASISGRVFSDNNQNGVQDANDYGLAGWRVNIDGNGNGQYDPNDSRDKTTITDSSGNYTFSGLRPGTYPVSLDIAAQGLSRWSQVAPAGGAYSVSLNSGDMISGKLFANYLDRSAPAANEWGAFEGGRMNLYTGLAWVDESQVTGGFFSWNFAQSYVANSTRNGYDDWRMPTKTESLAAADNGISQAGFLYSPSEVPGYSYLTSTTSGNKTWAVHLTNPNDSGELVNKDNAALALPMVRDSGFVIDDGGVSYSTSGFTNKSTSGAYLGDQSTAASGTGSKTATWTFGGLEVGATYKVAVTWKTATGAASNSPFKVFDGAATLATVAVNQKVTPGDFPVAETWWRDLGTFTLANNTLKIQLSNLANGTVIADAVRIFKAFPSYAPPAPLMAAATAPHPTGGALSAVQAEPLLAEALRRWQQAGVDTTTLGNIQLQIADLPGNLLGLAQGRTITLDSNAAGWGWFADPTPRSDSEFLLPGDWGQQNHMDLLSAIEHELGHLLGYDHDEGEVMAETLTAGERHNPKTGSTVEVNLTNDVFFWFAPEKGKHGIYVD